MWAIDRRLAAIIRLGMTQHLAMRINGVARWSFFTRSVYA